MHELNQAKLSRTFLPMVVFLLMSGAQSSALADSAEAVPPAREKMTPVDVWTAVGQMAPGINIGNTLDNTVRWETGWGSPIITREYIQSLARLGFKTVRLPVAWDTYADHGRITPEEFHRVGELVDWITSAGMYCVVNIHWDGGWIDSDDKKRFPDTYATFSPEAEKKYQSYWEQISRFYAGKNQKLIFEAFNEESNFSNAGSEQKAYATLNHVNQLFVDTVRRTGGNNYNRLLIVAGYSTDISKTCRPEFKLPRDSVKEKLLLSIHYYSPWQFVGLNENASWGRMFPTWGSADDVKQLNQAFDTLNDFCARNDTPAFIGEFAVCSNKEAASQIRWTTAVATAALQRKMVPVLWDAGGAVSRRAPYLPSNELSETLGNLKHSSALSTQTAK
jgi:endoglucanase